MGLKIENQNESCLGRADDDDGAGCLRLVHTQVGRSSESRQPKSQSSPVRTPEGGRERAFEKLFNETDSGGGAGWAYISEVDERNIRVPGGVRSIFYTIQIPHTVFPLCKLDWKLMRLLLWEVDVKRACCCGWALVSQARESYRRPGRLFRSLRDLGADSISIAALVPRWPIFEQVPISAGEASRSNHSWREVSLPSSSSYGTTCFFLSFFHCLFLSFSLSLSLSSLHPSLAACHSSPLMPAAPRSTCTWGSRSRSSACSPRAFPLDSLSGPPRRSPGGAGVCRSSF